MVFYVYILKCRSKTTGQETLYTGSTQDLKTRIEQHQSGRGARYTKGKFLELMYFETFLTRGEAMSREYAIKEFPAEKKWQLITTFQKTLASHREESLA